MLVNNRYRLGALVRTGVMATFEAQEVPSGRNYYLHLVAHAGSSALSLMDTVRARLAAGRGRSSAPLVEIGDYDGTPYAVTEPRPELLDLQQWIDENPPQSFSGTVGDAGSGEAGAGGAADSGSTGEFTRMFRDQGQGAPGTQDPPQPPTGFPTALQPPATGSHTGGSGSGSLTSQPAAGPGRESAPGREPGEFTQLFSSEAKNDPPQSEVHGQKPPRSLETADGDSHSRKLSPEDRRAEMSHYRMVPRGDRESDTPPPWESPPGSRKPYAAQTPTQPEVASAGEPGEVTRLFQGGGGRAGDPDLPAPGSGAASPPRQASPESGSRPSASQLSRAPSESPGAPRQVDQPGEFTQLFQSGGQRQEKPSGGGPPAPPPREPDFWQPSPPQRESPRSDPGHANEPGQFTKQFGGPAPPPSTQQSPPQSSPPAPSSSGEFTGLFGPRQPATHRPDSPNYPPQPPHPAGKGEKGDFTRMFGGPADAPRGSGVPSPQAPWPPSYGGHSEDQADKPGDFTRLFGKQGGRRPADIPIEDIQPPGGATEMYRGAASRPPAPPPPASQEPGEYTRVAGKESPLPRQQAPPVAPVYPVAPPPTAMPVAPVPPPAPPPVPPPAPAASQPAAPQPAAPQRSEKRPARNADRSMYLILALVFCALLLVALGIVLFVTLTGDNGEPQAAPAGEQSAPRQAPAGIPATGLTPSITAPSATAPSVSAPAVSAPSASGSGISGGSLSAPSVSQPSLTAPRASMPSVSAPSAAAPRLPSGQIPSSAAPQPAVQAAAPASSGTPYLALIIILSVLLVVAVGAAVYFALRRA